MKNESLTRRQLLRLSVLAGAGAAVAACGAAAPAAPAAPAAEAPKAEEAPAAEAPKAEEAKPTEAPKQEAPAAPAADGSVPRNRTLIVCNGLDQVGLMNPWTAGYSHQQGNALLWEPLFYYSLFADKELPWLAESGTYNAEFTELTIKLRKGAEWSDGKPVTARDVKFTLDGQKSNEKLNYHTQVDRYVKEVKVVDDQTAVVMFNAPSPRFKFEILSLKFDTGIPMVPAHALEGETDVVGVKGAEVDGAGDVTESLPNSGPYRINNWTVDQKQYVLREDWWGVKIGFQPLSEVKRVIFTQNKDMQVTAQRIVNNEFDATLDLRTELIKSTLEANPKITTHTGDKPPHGYLDWWPNSLWMNLEQAPYSDANVRRAISLSVDRPKLNEVLFDEASIATIYPFPLYPNLQKFADSAPIKALEEKYQPGKFDLDESGKLMEGAGFAKNGDGLWEKDGQTVSGVVNGFESIHADIVPVVVEMLRAGGFDASINFGTDAYQNMADGKPGFYMFGHGASLVDPFAVFELYTIKPRGNTAGSNNFSRLNNAEFDALVATMAPLDAADPKFRDAAAKAMEIYWRDVIDVPLIQWLHRIPMNQTYWTNWPTESNAYLNGAFWHHTFPVMALQLKPAA
jgi:peptide/nickel transport system substrate-binding protein